MRKAWPPRGEADVHAPGEESAFGAERRRGWLARRSWHIRLLIMLPVYAGVLATILVSAQLIRYTIRFPDPRALRINEPGPTLKVLARDGSVLAERGERNEFVPLDRLPRHLVDAVISIEDRRFHSHWGLDPAGLVRAAYTNLRAGRTAQGGSTLTQQLAKNLFLSTDRTMSRKVEEVVLALWLELRLTKREILELYLNRVYFGGGAYGVEAAAQRFFGKSARSVNVAEGAVIAGLLKAPSKYSPFANPGHARARARIVISSMLAARAISPVSAAAASQQSVTFADPQAGRKPNGLEYAIDYVLDEMPPMASVGKRAVIVETTIDADLQKRAQATIEATLAKDGAAAKAGQAAMVVLDTSGGVRALVGGRSFAESQFNRAVKARRQPGSAFKPLVYLAAVEGGMWPDTPVVDQPIEIGQWNPRNDDGRYRGPLTLTQALAHSVNTVAVRLQQNVGADKVAGVAQRLGIRSRLRQDASMALGTSEVGLLELAGAYGTLAAGGAAVEPFAIRRIVAADGEVLFERPEPRPRMVVAPDSVGAMNTMLNAAVVSGTGRRAAFPRHQAAGKTGTTQDFRDAWFVGYTAHLVGGVWFGNDDGAPMSHVMGGGLPALVWRDVMAAAHEGLAPRSLPAIDASTLEPHRPAEPGAPRPMARSVPSRKLVRDAVVPPIVRVPLRAAAIQMPASADAELPVMELPETVLSPMPPPPASARKSSDDPIARLIEADASRVRKPAATPEPSAAQAPVAGTKSSGLDPRRIREALGASGNGEPRTRMGLGAGQ